MRYRELAKIEPQIGDILGIEIGNTLVEAVIQDLRDDGVVIELDSAAVQILSEATKLKGTEKEIPGFGDPDFIPMVKQFPLIRPDSAELARRTRELARQIAMDPEMMAQLATQSAQVVPLRPKRDPGAQAFTQLKKGLKKVTPIRPGITIEPEPAKKREPQATKPSQSPDLGLTMDECENALDWGIAAVGRFSRRVKNKLKSIGPGATLAYLAIIADNTDAYEKNRFTKKQLSGCQDYLNYKVGDAGVETWDDLLDSAVSEEQNHSRSQKMKYDDYMRQAHEIQQRFQAAMRSGDKEAMAKIEQERAELDNRARQGLIPEAEYQGRKVALGKPMKGDVKKSKVYVRGPKGNVVKVNFGDPNMKIKKSNPKRRKSFRARHNCANPGPRWKARYWSCRAW